MNMYSPITSMVDALDDTSNHSSGVITWSSPVPVFGRLLESEVASVGLNPSNREFLDAEGVELWGDARRFPSLRSLKIKRWGDAESSHLRSVVESCSHYFLRNPYDTWFRRMDQILGGAGVSFYDPLRPACHLDLIPFATHCKWSELSSSQRLKLNSMAGSAIGHLVASSPLRVIVLNGRSVVEQFQAAARTRLKKVRMPSWNLSRLSGGSVAGYSYKGTATELHGVDLARPIVVLGYNHNVQSSYGVSSKVVGRIRAWIGQQATEVL